MCFIVSFAKVVKLFESAILFANYFQKSFVASGEESPITNQKVFKLKTFYFPNQARRVTNLLCYVQ
jgi:hypothetical protein